MNLGNPDHPIYSVATALLLVLATFGSLFCYYQQWESEKDLGTIATVVGTYVASAFMKQLRRNFLEAKHRDAESGRYK